VTPEWKPSWTDAEWAAFDSALAELDVDGCIRKGHIKLGVRVGPDGRLTFVGGTCVACQASKR
jgi:hypothetical protein